jgi:polysaccharide export outer membrane protein
MIDFPVIGKIKVAGMSREELSAHIKGLLIGGGLIKDPIVTVEYMNLTVSVLGEVNKPGRVYVDKDRITVIDAISMAGDLTIHGRRDRVMVMRVDGDDRITYTLDLRSAEGIYTSPAYYLRQGDVVYVSPNSMRSRQSTVNGNNVLSASFWISITSLVATITALFIR